jgi:hypothetical protein
MGKSFECISYNDYVRVYIYEPLDDDGEGTGLFCYNLETFGNVAYKSDEFEDRGALVMHAKDILKLIHVDVEELNIDFSSFWQSTVER